MPRYNTDQEFISLFARELKISPQEVKEVIKIYNTSIKKLLIINGELNIRGLGKFVLSQRKRGKGRNIRTGEVVEIPITITVKFRPAHSFKQIVNERVRRVRKEKLGLQ